MEHMGAGCSVNVMYCQVTLSLLVCQYHTYKDILNSEITNEKYKNIKYTTNYTTKKIWL